MWIKPVNKDYILTEDTIAHKHYNYHKKDLIQVHDAISERWIRMVLKDHVILDDYIYTPRTTI